MATRLVRGWTHLERQRGGSIGLRGPGETQLETDRRLLQKRVEQLQKRLDKVEVQHTQMRRARVRSELPRVALVGYTNAGKSTLFNALTGADAYAADQLFATLDPTVRRIAAAGRQRRCWPIPSVSSATCRTNWSPRSARRCPRRARPTCCCTSIDAADPLRDERIAQVDAVLRRDRRRRHPAVAGLQQDRPDRGRGHRATTCPATAATGARERVWLSARDGAGLDLLRDALGAAPRPAPRAGELQLPPAAGRLRARLHELGAVRARAATTNTAGA